MSSLFVIYNRSSLDLLKIYDRSYNVCVVFIIHLGDEELIVYNISYVSEYLISVYFSPFN